MSLFILRDQILLLYSRLPKRSVSILIVVYSLIFEWFRRAGFTHVLRIWIQMGLL